jgi:hypothetical protein
MNTLSNGSVPGINTSIQMSANALNTLVSTHHSMTAPMRAESTINPVGHYFDLHVITQI